MEVGYANEPLSLFGHVFKKAQMRASSSDTEREENRDIDEVTYQGFGACAASGEPRSSFATRRGLGLAISPQVRAQAPCRTRM